MSLREMIMEIQGLVGVKQDGVFGIGSATAVRNKLTGRPAETVVPTVSLPSVISAGRIPVEQIPLDAHMACELADHEAIVLEMYKDSKNINTWGIGVTSRSGHSVERYKDEPQTLERVFQIYLWLLSNQYIPDVLKAFRGYKLTREEFTAAISFHYNTGAIGTATWVRLWKEWYDKKPGATLEAARASFMTWTKDKELIGRRTAECQLFFNSRWSTDGKVTVFPVRKPSYQPDFKRGYLVDVMPTLEKMLSA